MDTRAASEAIQQRVKADPRKSFVKSFFDEQAFGNFWIIYDEGGERLSIVNDRDKVTLNDSRTGNLRATLLSDLRTADEKTLLRAIP
jgi:hypothetical protein